MASALCVPFCETVLGIVCVCVCVYVEKDKGEEAAELIMTY